MIVTCSYTEKADRERLYWQAWRILANYSKALSEEDRRALLAIKRAFFRGDEFDSLIASYVEKMSRTMLTKKAYAY